MKKHLFVIVFILFFPVFVFTQNRYAVVIDEIMADPSPQVGLPNNEWIELKNISSSPVNLAGWRIADASGQSGPMPNFTLQPDSFVIVCAGSAVAAMSAFGTTISVTSFPSLDNAGDMVSLRSNAGNIIHAVSYTDAWYQNTVKKDGGWTLEMSDAQNPCAGISNWKASIDIAGGTPGRRNSTNATLTDASGPSVLNAFSPNNTSIIIVFDEPIDSITAAASGNYLIDGGITIQSASGIAPLFERVQLLLNTPLSANTVYNIIISNVKDCKGNIISANNKTRTGIATDAAPNDVVVNEILFNPKSSGSDYAEFYNRSNKIIDANRLYIANRNSGGVISSQKLLSGSPFYIFPGDYVVITEDGDRLALDYFVKNPKAVLTVSLLPSFPDDEGTVVLLNFQGEVVDEVAYKDDWHFKLIDNPEGVSLERIDPGASSQDANHWHSAASTAGYGTPGYQNSQYKLMQNFNATISVSPKTFSPDNDGRDDIATIQYKVTEPGYVANSTIYDAAGRPIRNLVKNATLGLQGYWIWDGLDDKGQKLPVGTYIIYTEVFNLNGKKESFKNIILLARILN